MIRVSFWTAVFLVALRVCIGWHFFYEGLGKVKSAYAGKATIIDKPFSSEAYFRESEGPFGRVMKKWIGDPDREIIEKLTLLPMDGDKVQSPIDRFPESLAKEWDDYLKKFVAEYKLDEAQKTAAQKKLDEAKAKFVAWLDVNPKALKNYLVEEKAVAEKLGYLSDTKAGKDLEESFKKKAKPYSLTVKRTAPGGNASATFDEEVTVLERVDDLRRKSAEVRTIYEEKLPQFGKDIAGASLRALKADVAAIRGELNKELDSQTTKMKDSLATLFGNRFTGYAAKIDQLNELDTLKAMLVPMKDGNPLGKLWDEYAAYIRDFAPNVNADDVTEKVQTAKVRFDRWLADTDEFSGKPTAFKTVETLKSQIASPTEGKMAVGTLQAELKRHTDALKAQLGSLTDEQKKGYVAATEDRYFGIVPKLSTPIAFMDWMTRWFLVIVGSCLIVGLFSRFMCFNGSVFLLLTVLTQPSLPWLPAPPNSEGNYLIVNKNVIEMVALWALMTTRSGLWLGLDAIIVAIFGRKE
jgi:uncharacterized membrane protein YphA (DoxX/SURF4 family)